MADRNGGAEFFAGLIIGGLVGAALALLLAPQSGEETRAQIREKSLEYKDRAEEGVLEASHAARQQVSTLQEKGKEVLEKGRQSATEVIDRTKDSAHQVIDRARGKIDEEAEEAGLA